MRLVLRYVQLLVIILSANCRGTQAGLQLSTDPELLPAPRPFPSGPVWGCDQSDGSSATEGGRRRGANRSYPNNRFAYLRISFSQIKPNRLSSIRTINRHFARETLES